MAEAAAPSVCVIKLSDNIECGPDDRCDDKLGNTITSPDTVRVVTEIDQAYLYFSTIIRINNSCMVNIMPPGKTVSGNTLFYTCNISEITSCKVNTGGSPSALGVTGLRESPVPIPSRVPSS